MSEKVQLRDPRPTRTVELPSFSGSVVEFWPSLMMGDLIGVDPKGSDVEQGIKILPRLIKSWNFTDDKGADLAANQENLEKLPSEDVTFLFDEIKKFAEEQKKSSSV